MLCRNNIDPFDEPECEARDIFVNEVLCIGTGTYCIILFLFSSCEGCGLGLIKYKAFALALRN